MWRSQMHRSECMREYVLSLYCDDPSVAACIYRSPYCLSLECTLRSFDRHRCCLATHVDMIYAYLHATGTSTPFMDRSAATNSTKVIVPLLLVSMRSKTAATLVSKCASASCCISFRIARRCLSAGDNDADADSGAGADADADEGWVALAMAATNSE